MEDLMRQIDAYMRKYPEAQNPLVFLQLLGNEEQIFEILAEAAGRRIIFVKGRGKRELLWFFENTN